jgi:soluble lytic murein transglycosylase
MSKLALSLLLFPLLFSSISAQNLDDANGRVRQEMDDRNYLAAIAELQKIKSEQPAVFEANNYNYLLARLSDRTGDMATAAANYQAVVNADSVLKEYALWHLSQIARGTGNLLLERTYLQRIAEFSPDSLRAAAAKSRLARSWFESASYDQVIKMLTAPQPAPSPTDVRRAEQAKRQNLVLLGDAYLKSGDAAKAKDIYTRLVTEISNPAQPDDFALAAAKALDALDTQQRPAGSAAQPLPDFEHLRRASIYQFNRDFNDARKHYAAIVENFPTSGIVPDAMFQIGRGYAQEGNLNEAVNWYERVQEQFPDHPVVKDALLQAASAYSRLGKYREAVSRYQKFIDTYKDDERLDRAYLNIVDALRDSRQDADALKWATTTQEVFKGKQAEAQALFDQAKIYLSQSDFQNSLAALEKLRTMSDLGGATAPGGTNAAEVAFLRGFVLENLGRFREAVEVYLSIPDGRNEYYGGRSTERLRLLAANEAARPIIKAKLAELTAPASKEKDAQRRDLQAAIRLADSVEERRKLLDSLKTIYQDLPAYRSVPHFEMLKIGRDQARTRKPSNDAASRGRAIADELLFLGLYDEAGPEVEAGYRPKEAPPAGAPKTDLDYTIAVIYNRGDRADRSAAFIEPSWKMPADYQFELIPRDIAEMLYPVPYVDPLVKFGPPRDVDPRYLLSIMRQESRFRADVKSYAAARGLMQFISSTSDRIATELGRKNFVQDDLYDPATAILFGSQYLGNLFKMFPQQPEAVAASYNGGEDNMKRWMSRSRSDQPDRYVPEIVFAQSKDYVYRVMANYRVYQYLYDSNLKARQ